MNRIKILLLFCVLLPAISNGQSVDTSQSASDKRKLRRVAIGAGVIYTGAMVGLNQLWYADNGHTSFRFFNDNREWKQVDKLGHFYAAFHISDGSSRVLKSMNVEERKANLIGAATAFAVLMPIEIFDGHSKAYGASVGDLIANTTGAGFFLLQQHLWSETRIHPKFSFHSTRFATKRPELLGDGFQEELLKDYRLISTSFSVFPNGSIFPSGMVQREWFTRAITKTSLQDLVPHTDSCIWPLTGIYTISEVGQNW